MLFIRPNAPRMQTNLPAELVNLDERETSILSFRLDR